MPVTLNSTGISFSDGNSQNSAGGSIGGSNAVQTFNNPSTVAKPSNMIGMLFSVAGGGGGSHGFNGPRAGGTGGKAFGFAAANAFPGNNIPLSIGSGGNPGQQQQPAGAGNATTIGGNITANGGNGARGVDPGISNGSPGNVSGGAMVPNPSIPGGAGGAAIPTPQGFGQAGQPGTAILSILD